MQVISIDFETYSEADLFKQGAYAYACHPSTEVICMAYAIGDQAPKLWLPEMPRPEFLSKLSDYTFSAWNSFFEYVIWHNVLSWPTSQINQWRDTAAQAAALALPRALGACGAALGIPEDKQKDKRGKQLIQKLCKPVKGKRVIDEELYQELYDYCLQDVESERYIAKKLRPLSENEQKVWELDQTINLRGVPIDMESVDHAIDLIDQTVEKLNQRVSQLTKGRLVNVSQRAVVLGYVNDELDYPLLKYDKAYLRDLLQGDELPYILREIISIRLQTGKTSTAKYAALKKVATKDKRAHGLLMYHGASTGRWSGKLFQPQNLPRPAFDKSDDAMNAWLAEQCIAMFTERNIDDIEVMFGDAMDAYSWCLRGMIKAEDGKRLLVADYSAIEARVLAWLAGQKDVLDVFKGHGKIYEHTASQIYKCSIDAVTKEQRFIGKVATLALGYQGGAKAFQGMAESYGVDIPESLADRVKTDWRNANSAIVSFWYAVENAAVSAVRDPSSAYRCRGIAFRFTNGFLFLRLPSGRLLAYYAPELTVGKFDKEQVSFMGVGTLNRKWCRQTTYGGKLVENITQAVARDLIAEAMLRLEAAGYPIILSVHDEILAEVDEGFGSLNEFNTLMCELPSWAEGLPVEADGFEAKRYRK